MADGIEHETRAGLKKIVPRQLWPFFRILDGWLTNCLYVWFWLLRLLRYPTVPVASRFGGQCIETIEFKLNFQDDTQDDIEWCLKQCGITYFAGRHSVYVPPGRELEKLSPGLSCRFPIPIGLKIIKNRQLAPDGTPYYTSSKIAPASTWFSMRAVGSMQEKMVLSNLLGIRSVAPRIYAIVKLGYDDSPVFAFIVEHMSGGICSGEPAQRFMHHFTRELQQLGMEILSIKEHRDLRPPDFNQNIVSGSDSPRYVDIQNFVIVKKNGFYQSIVTKTQEITTSSQLYQEIKRISKDVNYDWCNQEVVVLGHLAVGSLKLLLAMGVSWGTAIIATEQEKKCLYDCYFMHGYGKFDVFALEVESLKKAGWSSTDPVLAVFDFNTLVEVGINTFFEVFRPKYCLCYMDRLDNSTAKQSLAHAHFPECYEVVNHCHISPDEPRVWYLLKTEQNNMLTC